MTQRPLQNLKDTLLDSAKSDEEKARAILIAQQDMLTEGASEFKLEQSLRDVKAILTAGGTTNCYAYPLLAASSTSLPTIVSGSPNGNELPDVYMSSGDATPTVDQNRTMDLTRFCACIEKKRVNALGYDDLKKMANYREKLQKLQDDGLLTNDLANVLNANFIAKKSGTPKPVNAPQPKGGQKRFGCCGLIFATVAVLFFLGSCGHLLPGCNKTNNNANSNGGAKASSVRTVQPTSSQTPEEKARALIEQYKTDHPVLMQSLREECRNNKLTSKEIQALEKYMPWLHAQYTAYAFGTGDSTRVVDAYRTLGLHRIDQLKIKEDKVALQMVSDAERKFKYTLAEAKRFIQDNKDAVRDIVTDPAKYKALVEDEKLEAIRQFIADGDVERLEQDQKVGAPFVTPNSITGYAPLLYLKCKDFLQKKAREQTGNVK